MQQPLSLRVVMLVATVALRIASEKTFRAELVRETVDAQQELVPAGHRSECARDNLTPQMVRLLCSARCSGDSDGKVFILRFLEQFRT